MELMTRKDVPQELTWDLTALYKTEADFQSDIDKVKAVRIVQQQPELTLRVAAKKPLHGPQVAPLHTYYQVMLPIVAFAKLPGGFARRVYAVLHELAPCGRVYRVAQLLAAGAGRSYGELKPRLCGQVLHHELGHRAAAYVSKAHKEYSHSLCTSHSTERLRHSSIGPAP